MTADHSNHDSSADDQTLIDATLAGQTEPYCQLVQRYQTRLLSSLESFTGSAEEAQDVAQEAFVAAHQKLADFRGGSAFYTWLYRIAFNRAISRSRSHKKTVSLDSPSAAESPAVSPSPEHCAVTEERIQLVRIALAKLPEEFRQVVVLRDLDGFDYQQIAEVASLPIGTVRSRIARGRKQLRDLLAPMLEAELRGADKNPRQRDSTNNPTTPSSTTSSSSTSSSSTSPSSTS